MELHSAGLNSDPSNETQPPPPEKTAFSDNMFSCLDAGKSFLDVVLECSLDQYRIFSFVEWMRLPVVLLNIAKLSFENDRFAAAGWDPRTARSHVRLDLYLESLCYRMQSLTTFNPPSQPYPDFFPLAENDSRAHSAVVWAKYETTTISHWACIEQCFWTN